LSDLEEARRIILEGLGSDAARVWLFGSRARGDAGRASDIDVAVLPEAPLPPGLLQEIREALENSLILYPVQLVDLTTAESSLREAVLAEGVPWTN
jgi:predicted nucleotidyltransferase